MNVRLLCERDVRREIINSSNKINSTLSHLGPIKTNSGLIIDDVIQKYILNCGKDIHERIIGPLILDAVIRSENNSGGSGEICLSMISSQIESVSKKIKLGLSSGEIKEENEERVRSLSKLINKSARKLSKTDICNLIDKIFTLDSQKRIANSIIEKSNIKSPFFLERSHKRETILSFSQGYNFEIPITSDFLPEGGMWERRDVEVLIIDGIVESIGEIHHLLERASANKNPIVMFVRHLSDDVKSTLILNIKRNTIDLIPIEVGFDEDTVNILNDIAICCNSDIVSAYKGDLISTSSSGCLSSVKKVTLTKKGVNILNNISEKSLISHLKYLEERRDSSHEIKIKKLFDTRIRSLSSGKILLRVGNDLLRKDIQSIEKFDKFFRELRSLIQYGVIYKSMIDIDNAGFNMRDCYPYSSVSIFFAARHTLSLISNIFSIKGALISDSI